MISLVIAAICICSIPYIGIGLIEEKSRNEYDY